MTFIITFTDQNGRPLEMEYKINLTLLIDKQKCDVILQNQEQENISNDLNFYYLQKNIKKDHWIQGWIL